MNRSLWMVMLAMALLLGTPGVIDAQGTPTSGDDAPKFLLRPKSGETVWFDLEIEAGASVSDTLIFGMAGPNPTDVSMYLVDAYSQTNGGFGVREAGSERTGPTTWVTFADEAVTLVPDQVQERSVTVSVPEGTPPGQYITGIAMQTVEPLGVAGADGFSQILRTAVAILITVPGDVQPSFTVANPGLAVDGSTTMLQVEIANSGNVLVKPSGTATLFDDSGVEVARAPVAMDSVYAGMSALFRIAIPAVLPEGSYLLTIDLEDAETGATASLDRAPTALAPVIATAVATAQLRLTGFVATPLMDADGVVQGANLTVQFENTGSPVAAVKLTVRVARDGDLVEDYALSAGTTVVSGASQLEQRYVPLGGWKSGQWTFAVIAESVDPTSGQSAVVGTVAAPSPISIP